MREGGKGKEKKGRQTLRGLKMSLHSFPVKEKQNAKHLSSYPRCACLLFPPTFPTMMSFLCSILRETMILQILEFEDH